jgi:protein-tyrosine phosphatase
MKPISSSMTGHQRFTARRTIDETFGSLDGYLRDAGITAVDIDRLHSALLA